MLALPWRLLLAGVLALAWSAATAQPTDCAPRITQVQAAQAPADGAVRPGDGWTPVTLPDRWTDSRWPGYSGSVWYRIDWQRGCDGADATPVALALDSISMAGEVWVGDALLWRDRSLVEPLSRSWNMPRYWDLPAALLQPGSNTLWVHVVGVAAQAPGLGAVHLGAPQALQQAHEARWWRQRTLFGLNLTLSAAMGGLFFFIWLLQRAQTAFGWFTLTTFSWVLFIANVLVTDPWPFPDTLTATRANASLMLLYVACFCVFTWRFGAQHWPRLERGLWALMALLVAALWLMPEAQLPWILLLALLASAAVFLGNCVQFIAHALRTREIDQLLLAACLLVYIVVSVHDLLAVLQLLPGAQAWTPYSSVVTMAAMSAVLGWRIAQNRRRIERFNEELRQGIAKARADLGSTLAREHELELANIRLQERLALAHDLHDGLGGSLVRSIALVEQAGARMENRQFLSVLKLLRDDLRQVIDSGSSAGASVPATPQQWLAPLRHRFMQLFDELEIDSDWQVPPAWLAPPGALQCLVLTRVLEEALANVIKHSRARRVQVELAQDAGGHLLLRVADDGVGFDVAAVLGAGLSVGMRSMQARIARVGGRLQVDSRPGATVLTATLAPHGSASARPAQQRRRAGAQYWRAGSRTVKPSSSGVSMIWQLRRLPSSAGSAVNSSISSSPRRAGGTRERQGSST